mmetsp:Transcript_101767/g.140650  ORF Transcript_101767/g.140650 Transcript_101767/m.140650 type:complete len:87 (+) Transcript_101767:1358-1618(+)
MGPGKVLNFNTIKQSRDFDGQGKYIKMWVPELSNVPVDYIHEPWKMPLYLQKQLNIHMGQDYPHPIKCDKYLNPGNFKPQNRNRRK